jgi:CheY-like chemotaxis protein
MGDRVRIAVRDTGVGIPVKRQAELFQPFSRLGAETRAIEGTGVGLALSRRLVELMGGDIGFSSIPNEGSCFWVDIPVYDSAAVDDARGEAAALPEHVDLSGFSVLYVEDNPANLSLVRNIFAPLRNVTMLEATDGTTGVALAARHRPDVIVLDINLPDISGFEVLQQLRRLPELSGTPILALSAGVLPYEIQRGLDAGFFRYLTKPLNVRNFLSVIHAALASKGVDAAAGAASPQ